MNIIGRLVKNAEVRTLSNDKEVVNFSIAVNDSYKNKQGERVEQTAFLDCAYWLTAKVAQFLTKGTLVELTGRLSTRAWIGKDGEAHAGLNFHTSQVKLHGGGKERTVTQDAIKTQTAEAMNIQSEVEDLPF